MLKLVIAYNGSFNRGYFINLYLLSLTSNSIK